MAITTFNLNVDVEQIIGVPALKATAHIGTNAASDAIYWPAEGETRAVGGTHVLPAGVGTLTLPHTNIAGANPATFQYVVMIEVAVQRGTAVLGPYYISAPVGTVALTLPEIAEDTEVPADYVTGILAQMQDYAERAEAAQAPVMTAFYDGGWPARPTANPDIAVFWIGGTVATPPVAYVSGVDVWLREE